MSRSLIPNSTQIPDIILDEWMPHLSGAELSVVMLVARKTYGWGKKFDRISLTQMEEGTGLARSTVASTCDRLHKRGMLQIAPGEGKKANAYMLNLDWCPIEYTENATSTKTELVRKSDATVPEIEPFTSTKIEHTRDTERDTKQETTQRLKKDVGNAPTPVKSGFKAPTIEEVRSYFSEHGRSDLADEWFGYWDSVNWWRKKGVRMQKWRSAAGGWIAGKKSDAPGSSRASPPRNGRDPATTLEDIAAGIMARHGGQAP